MKLREAEVGLASGTGSQTLQVTGTGSYPLEWTSNGPGSNLVPLFVNTATFVSAGGWVAIPRYEMKQVLGIIRSRDNPPSETLQAHGVAGNLFVVRRRRCPRIASFSLRDLASQAPRANVTVFTNRST